MQTRTRYTITGPHSGCGLVSPIFFADDGVLGPNLRACRDRWKSLHQRVDAFERVYLQHLTVAARHLDDWCTRSRMRFGQEKTQVVVFNRGDDQGDAQLFGGIPLCGYQVDVATSYDYLGLTLTKSLVWDRHAKRKLTAARAAAARVTTVALNARPAQPAIIRELVRACVVPAFDYGIEFWGNGLPDDTVRAFQAAVAKPLRVALGLPYTTHQHSVLWGCGVLPIATLTQHKQLLHLRRVSRLYHEDVERQPARDQGHPTVELYKYAHFTLPAETQYTRTLRAHVTLPLPVALLTSLLPSVDLSAAPPAGAATHPLASPTQWRERQKRALEQAQAAEAADVDARRDARRDIERQRQAAWAALIALHTPEAAAAAAPSGNGLPGRAARQPDSIRRVRTEAALLEWKETHMPATRAECDSLAPTDRSRRTTAPITRCAHDITATSHTGPPLRFLGPRHSALVRQLNVVRRARLLYGRSYTATVSRRFDAAAAASALCTHPQCTAEGQDESIEHLLLHCPRYAHGRAHLEHRLAASGLPLPLRLINVLNPPERGRRQYAVLYSATDAFLTSIAHTRQQLGLPSLDNCPHYDHSRRRQPRSDTRPAAPAATAAASAIAAITAPAPLDTG